LDQHEQYMRRAMDLASQGLGMVSPNPMVGCVIVYQGRIIGEGWHRKCGGPHAEVIAINSVEQKELLPESSLYVTLEPCFHYGKTPPCADLIISSGVKKVVIANQDPNPLVAGSGIEKLRSQGIEVVVGVSEKTGAFLNRRFFTFHQKKRPYIVLKWAQTSDGYLARSNYDSKWISNEYSRQLVHQYRGQEDAIVVGRNTAECDNPELTTRHWKGKNPVRIVLDPGLKLDEGLKLFDGSVQTLRYNFIQSHKESTVELVKVPQVGLFESIWKDLYQRQVQSVLIEGGATLLGSLISGNNWDEARVFTAPSAFGKGIKAPTISTPYQEKRMISGDELRIYLNSHARN